MKRFLTAILFLFAMAACNEQGTAPEADKNYRDENLVHKKTMLLDFSQPFEVELDTLYAGNNYEVEFSGLFFYSVCDSSRNDTSYWASQSGFYTSRIVNGEYYLFTYSYRFSSPLEITGEFASPDNLEMGHSFGAYMFKGTCSQTEAINLSFQNPWQGRELLNTSGLITVEIFMEKK